MKERTCRTNAYSRIGGIAVTSNRAKNQRAFREVEEELANRYPHGHFVAFHDGRIIADAPDFDQLTDALAAIGKNRPDVFVVQAGVEYPDEVFFF